MTSPRRRSVLLLATPLVVALAPVAAAQTFTDVWASAGFTGDEATQAIALGDYDGDGLTDAFAPSILVPSPIPFLPDLGGPNRCYRNAGSMRFEDRAPALGLADQSQPQGAAWADLDNDGDLDLYLVRGVQQAIAVEHLLYRQEGGRFDPAPLSGFVSAARAGRSVCWADYDRDGWLDVFVTNGIDSPDLLPDARVFLFRNDAGVAFTDVTVAAGLEDRRNGHGCAWGDYDNDGDLDLYVANKGFEDPALGLTDPQPNALYRNLLAESGKAAFVDVAAAAGAAALDAFDPASASFGAAWADYDNDGWLDLFVVNGFAGLIPVATPSRLFRNNRDGTFADASASAFPAGAPAGNAIGVTWGDFDNDGDLDFFKSGASVPLIAPARNELWINSGPPTFTFEERALPAGVAAQEWAGPCASADVNRDGYLDIYAVNGVPVGELFFENPDNLFLNGGGANQWLQLDLVGTISNRSAVGARVTLRTAAGEQTREVAAGSGYMSMDDLRVEFGLGAAPLAERVTIRWPSGCVQTLDAVAAGQVLQVVEECTGFLLRGPLADRPLALARYQPAPPAAPAARPWLDPQPVLADSESLAYQHTDPSVVVRMVKAGATVALSW